VRIAAFAVALVAIFGLAVAAGGALGPEPEVRAQEAGGHGGHGSAASPGRHGEHGSAVSPAVRGLAAAADGLRLVVATPELARGRAGMLRFRVLDAHDRPVRAFDVAHERRMHAIVVRHDLTGFQHVHPRMADDGTWSVPLSLDAPGSYRLYADFTHEGAARTLASDLRVDGDADLLPLPAPASHAMSDGGDAVRLDAGQARAGRETTLRFAVERDGRPVAVDPYLGAGGHLVALREGDLAFLHVHPVAADDEGRIAFATTLPSAGRHRLFLQYRVGPHVRTVAFTLAVAP